MTLTAGTRLGPYEILSPLGAGGMGEVYRARDSKLRRDVAIKVLPQSLSADADALARFEREALAVAALSHPNILAIHDFGNQDKIAYAVMELLEGETLRGKLDTGPIPQKQAVDYALQVVKGLSAAHEKGIVHRDLKPENLFVTKDGHLKILDFGLAKVEAVAPGQETSAPTASGHTEPGTVMGTPGYMSPEQVRGLPVDHRSDLFSFGAILYELLSGKKVFSRPTVADTLSAIMREEPPELSESGRKISPALDQITRHCLEKDRDNRFQSARDLTFALSTLAFPVEGPATASPPRARTTRSILPLPPGTQLAGEASSPLAISRDGSRVALVARTDDDPPHLYVCHLDRGGTERIPESEFAKGPFFSPDGGWVAFAADVSEASPRAGELRMHSFSSGLTQTVCPLPGFEGGFWGEDGSIYFVGSVAKGIWRVPSGGGRAEVVIDRFRVGEVTSPRCLGFPTPLSGSGLALVLDRDASSLGDLSLLDLQSGELCALARTGSAGVCARTGHLLYAQPDGTLLAAPFDRSNGHLIGPAVALLKDVALDDSGGLFSVSETGTLVFARGQLRDSVYELKRLLRLRRDGRAEALPFPPAAARGRPRLSPDGRSLVVSSRAEGIWIHDLSRGTRARLPPGLTRLTHFPLWSPDGERVIFRGALIGKMGFRIFSQRSDGSEQPEVLHVADAVEVRPRAFTPNGETLLFEVPSGDERGLWGLALAGKGEPRRLFAGDLEDPSLSPDGRFLAYHSGEFGSIEVFVQRFAERAGRVQVSVGGGRNPRWSRDGRELFYRSGDQFFTVPFDGTRAEPSFGSTEKLLECPDVEEYELAPDADGFLALARVPDSGNVRQLELVTGWFSELERLAPLPTQRP